MFHICILCKTTSLTPLIYLLIFVTGAIGTPLLIYYDQGLILDSELITVNLKVIFSQLHLDALGTSQYLLLPAHVLVLLQLQGEKNQISSHILD